MILKNEEIVTYTEKLLNVIEDEQLKLPAQLNYVIQKNFKNLLEIYKELHQVKFEIFNKYCTDKDEEKQNFYFDDVEKRKLAEEELHNLFNSKQEVNILFIGLNSLNNVELTMKQMEALMFMIAE